MMFKTASVEKKDNQIVRVVDFTLAKLLYIPARMCRFRGRKRFLQFVFYQTHQPIGEAERLADEEPSVSGYRKRGHASVTPDAAFFAAL